MSVRQDIIDCGLDPEKIGVNAFLKAQRRLLRGDIDLEEMCELAVKFQAEEDAFNREQGLRLAGYDVEEFDRAARAKEAGRTYDEQFLIDQIADSRGEKFAEENAEAILEAARARGDLDEPMKVAPVKGDKS